MQFSNGLGAARADSMRDACESVICELMEALEARELLSVAPVSRHHAHHLHHVHHLHQVAQVAHAAATVTTDKLDYQPGQSAIITGRGFDPHESVRLQVLHTDGSSNAAAEHQPWVVRADRHGGISTAYLVGQDDLNASMRLTAVGLSSNRVATEDFSDSGPIVRPDHIVIVIEEDRASDAIGDIVHMPYFNQLAASGLVYANSHGVAHPSLPDYLALYSGSTQKITDNGNNHTFSGPNLAKLFNSTQIAPGQYLSFGGFAESLPHDGDTTTRISNDPADPTSPPDLYMRNYNPMAQFTDVGSRGGVAIANAQVNKTFASFPTTASGFASLPTVSFVIPNALHNTHGSNEQPPYATDPSEYNFLRSSADTWLHDKMDGYLQWAKANNSLLIVTQDEEEDDSHVADDLTTIVNGDADLFVAGQNPNFVNHFNLVRTIEDMYGLTPLGNSATASRMDTNALGQLSTGAAAAAQTNTLLSADIGSSIFGQSVTFTATVSPIGAGVPSGTVTFKDGATVLGAGTLNALGVATFSSGALSAGAHSITASYGGDSAFASSASSALAYQVGQASTSVAIASAPNPTVFGQSVTLTATATTLAPGAGTPSGSVTFMDGANVLGSATLNASGVATLSTSALSVASHSITAVYAGNANLLGSTSTSLSHVVNQAGTITTVTSSANPAGVGQAINFTATVAATAPGGGTRTGTVQFVIDGANFGAAVALINGSAVSASISTLPQGTHTISALYGGDSNFAGSTSANLLQSIASSNDLFANRIVLTGTSITTTGNNATATKETGEPKHAGNAGGKSVWWNWTAPISGKVTIDTAGSSFDTILAVYTGSAVGALTAVSGGSNDDAGGGLNTSKVSFNVTAGTVYQIAVDGFNGASGNIVLHVNIVPPAPAVPTNVAASDGTFTDKIRITWTAAANATAYEVWRATTNSSSAASKISAADVTTTTYDDTTATPGATYYYFIKAKNAGGTSGFSASNAGFRLLANDAFANRIVLVGPSVTATGSNVGATKETGEPKHAGNAGGKSVWWTWTAPASGKVTIDTKGSTFDTLLAVYTGSSVSALTAVAGGSNDDDPAGGTYTSKVSFNVTAGTVYQIAVDGYAAGTGSVTLHINLV